MLHDTRDHSCVTDNSAYDPRCVPCQLTYELATIGTNRAVTLQRGGQNVANKDNGVSEFKIQRLLKHYNATSKRLQFKIQDWGTLLTHRTALMKLDHLMY